MGKIRARPPLQKDVAPERVPACKSWSMDWFKGTLKLENHMILMILVGGLEHFLFFNILGVIIPLTNMFQRGRSTTNQDTVNL